MSKRALQLGVGLFISLLLLGGVGWWYYQPSKALARDWERLRAAVENQRWETVGDYLAPHYTDAWGHNRQEALERLENALRMFWQVELTPLVEEGQTEAVRWEVRPEGTATQHVRLALRGTGNPLALAWAQRFNALPGGFTIEWERMTGWPPRWQVRSVCHAAANTWGL